MSNQARRRAFWITDRLGTQLANRWIRHFHREPDWLYLGWLDRPLCRAFGHVPTMDNCGIPDHDLCAYCQASMPNAAPRTHG